MPTSADVLRNRLNIALLDYVLSRAAVFAANAMSVSEYVERSVAKSKHLRGSAIVKRPLYNYVIARRSRGNPPEGYLVIKSNISQLHNYSQLIKKSRLNISKMDIH